MDKTVSEIKMMELGKLLVEEKTGEERLTYDNQILDFKLIDFWRWSVSDIISNATRGRFAEFIVATALQIDLKTIRDEWSAYDLNSPEGIKVEVKSAAYLQSWFQKDYSNISFSIRTAKSWDSLTNKQSENSERHADIYVFCLLKHKDKKSLDPMNLDQWEFYVTSTKTLDNYTRSKTSITLPSLQKLTKAVDYDSLRNAILEQRNNK
ncbi:MAG: hypothetical protein ACR2HG_15110 [Pyrinomonadaceae bacterium]